MTGYPMRDFAHAVRIGTLATLVECSFAHAEITPEARDAVEHHVAAIGGREALEAARTTHLWITLSALGLSGRTEVWLEAPDRRGAGRAPSPPTGAPGSSAPPWPSTNRLPSP